MKRYAGRAWRSSRLGTLVATAASSAVIIYGYATGPDPRYTGAPGDDPLACTTSGCHTGTALNAGGGNVVVIFPNGLTYTPGVQQKLTIAIMDSVAKAWGFQMTARLDSNLSKGQAGDFTAGAGQLVLCENSSFKTNKGCPANAPVQFIEHSNPFTTNTVTVTWTPPATDVGGVHIYVAAIAANKDGNSTGDHTYTANYALSAGPALTLSRNTLNFGYSGSIVTSPQSVLVSFTGIADVNWMATSDQANITVSPSSGNGNGSLQIMAAPGPSGMVTVIAPGTLVSPQHVQVNVRSVTPGLPFGSFDTPIDKSTGIVGAIPVTGWALDNIEVTKVDIWREPVNGEPPQSNGLVYVGDAVFVIGARTDVESLYPTMPWHFRGGWGYHMLTNFLPNSAGPGLGNGTYKIHAIAHNMSGSTFDLGTRAITVDNAHATKPFGTIDTPGQGGTASGNNFVNFGWALTPNPSFIPQDGSTLTVQLDGVAIGQPTYNNLRSDIASLFPGYANSNGAVGFLHIDTTRIANGVHTIAWVAYDNAGHGEGLGSRYFNVLNTGAGGTAAPEVESIETVASVKLRKGHDQYREPDSLTPDGNGTYIIEAEELDRIELHAGVNGAEQTLPPGSTLKGGVLYWQLAPGMLREYDLLLNRSNGAKIHVLVRVGPKRF